MMLQNISKWAFIVENNVVTQLNDDAICSSNESIKTVTPPAPNGQEDERLTTNVCECDSLRI